MLMSNRCVCIAITHLVRFRVQAGLLRSWVRALSGSSVVRVVIVSHPMKKVHKPVRYAGPKVWRVYVCTGPQMINNILN